MKAFKKLKTSTNGNWGRSSWLKPLQLEIGGDWRVHGKFNRKSGVNGIFAANFKGRIHYFFLYDVTRRWQHGLWLEFWWMVEDSTASNLMNSVGCLISKYFLSYSGLHITSNLKWVVKDRGTNINLPGVKFRGRECTGKISQTKYCCKRLRKYLKCSSWLECNTT